MARKITIFSTVVAIIVGALVALAGASNSESFSGIPIFAWCAIISFGVQWIAFIPAWKNHSEHFFDLTGSLTYLTVTIFAALTIPSLDLRATLLTFMVGLWAVRLGTFLYTRVKSVGADTRFDVMKYDFFWFLMTWTLQGLWVFLTSAAALAAVTTDDQKKFGVLGIVGLFIWIIGFVIEITADEQKRRFRNEVNDQGHQVNRGTFIRSGLWKYSRHPNYFGEITLWVGIAVIALPVLSGWTFVTLVSPLFVYLLLSKVSGIPMLEASANKRWGDNPEYQRYKKETPVLFLKFRR